MKVCEDSRDIYTCNCLGKVSVSDETGDKKVLYHEYNVMNKEVL